MLKITTVVTTVLVAVLSAGAAFAAGCGEKEEQAPEGTVYTCPMHPDVTSDKPGECPECGMDLVPKGKDIEGAAYFYPAHPDAKYDEPGKCPECG